MKIHIYIAIIVAPLMFIAGCQSMPSVTRSGARQDIFVKDSGSLSELRVNAGDEVRWTNKRMEPIQIVFYEPVHDRISCRNNFGGFFTGGTEATLDPNESASLCFHEPASYSYVVRMKSVSPGGEVHVAGFVRVGGPLDQPSGQEIPGAIPEHRTHQ